MFIIFSGLAVRFFLFQLVGFSYSFRTHFVVTSFLSHSRRDTWTRQWEFEEGSLLREAVAPGNRTYIHPTP